jgi:hypothetical protein
MQENRLSIIQPRKGKTLAKRLEKFYTTAAAKDRKRALEELSADERKFLLMSHAVGESRITNRIMTILLASVILVSLTSSVPYLGSLLPYPFQTVLLGFLFLVWGASLLATLGIGLVYLSPVLTGKFRNMINSIGSAKLLEQDNLITPKQAQDIVQENSREGLFSRLASNLTERLAGGVSLRKMQVNVKEAKSRQAESAHINR